MSIVKKLSLVVSCFLFCALLLGVGVRAQEAGAQDGPFSIAVLDFEDQDENSRRYGSSDSTEPSKAIPAVLTTELVKSDRFTVIERSQLESVLKEQQLGASGAVTAETAARLGQVLGVEYLVVGNITEFTVEEGKSKSFSLFGMGSSSTAPSVARVSIEVKVLDTESARIVATASCRKTLEIGKGGGGVDILGVRTSTQDSGSSDAAMANVYYAIASDLAKQLETVKFKSLPAKVKYTGFVAYVEGDKAYINLGAKQGITPKLVFNVRRDLQKGTIKIKKTVAEIQVLNVDEESSECQIIKVEAEDKVQAGDLVESKF